MLAKNFTEGKLRIFYEWFNQLSLVNLKITTNIFGSEHLSINTCKYLEIPIERLII